MLPTPNTSHVAFTNVYNPSEDSYLLLDVLSSPQQTAYLARRFHPFAHPSPTILEVGTGSGVVLSFLTTHAFAIFNRSDVLSLGTDVNPFAVRAARDTVHANLAAAAQHSPAAASAAGILADVLHADLCAPLRAGVADVLIFNPPYVPSEGLPSAASPPAMEWGDGEMDANAAFARDSHLLSLATDGGADGVEVTLRLLGALPEVLGTRGVAYVLLCKRNRPEEVMGWVAGWEMEGWGGWEAEIVGDSGKTAGFERLVVVRIARRLGD